MTNKQVCQPPQAQLHFNGCRIPQNATARLILELGLFIYLFQFIN